MAGTAVSIKDLEQAQALSVQLGKAIEDLASIAANQVQLADTVLALNETATLNEQASKYFKESGTLIQGLIPDLEQVNNQLKNAINSMSEFEELNKQNMLGSV